MKSYNALAPRVSDNVVAVFINGDLLWLYAAGIAAGECLNRLPLLGISLQILAVADKALSKQFYAYGKKKYKWV